MRLKFLIYMLAALPSCVLANDTVQTSTRKTLFSIQLGAHYKTFLGSKFIKPEPYDFGDDFTKHQYERFFKIPTLGFNAGFLFTCLLASNYGVCSGLQYFFHNDIFESNQDTIIKYGNVSSMRDIRNAIKYNYANNSLELPLMLYYTVGRFSIYTGCNFSLITYSRAKYTYVVNQFPNEPRWITLDKTVYQLAMPLKVFPTLQASYGVKVKNIRINPYLAFIYELKNQGDFYLQFGVKLPLRK